MLEWGGEREPARLAAMTCTCRGSDNPHEHHFVESELLKTLAIGAEVDLNLDVHGGVLSLTVAS